MTAESLADLERQAADRMPRAAWDFVAGGSGTETTLDANRAAFDRIGLVPRVLVDVAEVTTACTLAGTPAALPVAVAPMGYQGLAHADGDLAAARAAAAAGVPFTVSTLSSARIEDVAALGGPVWFQLYWLRDRGLTMDLVRRAEDAGARALVLTVDVPVLGRRLRDVHNRFTLPPSVVAANLGVGADSGAHQAGTSSAIAEHTGSLFDPSLTWSDLAWLRENTRLPLIVKGVLHPADAARATEAGACAVVVSNHGGRQLDGAVPSAAALPEVVAAVDGRCEVLLDSGVRSGTDVVRALALGARGVLVGRPVWWGLAAAGVAGVARVLELLATELVAALRLTGCPDLTAASLLTTRPLC